MNVALHRAEPRPGFAALRICRLMRAAIARCGCDLSGMRVLTEAATGAYAVTAPLAALAGAVEVVALARGGRHGTAADARHATMSLAEAAGVGGRVRVVEALPDDLGGFDLVTNSGHLRPLDASVIGRLRAGCTIALMFEAWELREGDLDVAACHARGIPIVGVSEQHPSVDVFSYHGALCLRALHDAGLPGYGNRIALLCDNDFAPSILRSFAAIGAEIACFTGAADVPRDDWDCVLVALHPAARPRLDAAGALALSRAAPGATVVQLWGDVEREALRDAGLPVWPPHAPRPGHMGVLLSEIGPDAVVRLQAGGLAAAALVAKGRAVAPGGLAQLV